MNPSHDQFSMDKRKTLIASFQDNSLTWGFGAWIRDYSGRLKRTRKEKGLVTFECFLILASSSPDPSLRGDLGLGMRLPDPFSSLRVGLWMRVGLSDTRTLDIML